MSMQRCWQSLGKKQKQQQQQQKDPRTITNTSDVSGVSILSIVIASLPMLCTNPDCIVLHRAESMCFSNNSTYLIVLVVLLYFVGIAVLFFLYLRVCSTNKQQHTEI